MLRSSAVYVVIASASCRKFEHRAPYQKRLNREGSGQQRHMCGRRLPLSTAEIFPFFFSSTLSRFPSEPASQHVRGQRLGRRTAAGCVSGKARLRQEVCRSRRVNTGLRSRLSQLLQRCCCFAPPLDVIPHLRGKGALQPAGRATGLRRRRSKKEKGDGGAEK